MFGIELRAVPDRIGDIALAMARCDLAWRSCVKFLVKAREVQQVYSLNGLVNNSVIQTNENLHAFEGRRVIITILDDTMEAANQSAQKALDTRRKAAARELAGLWESYNMVGTVDDMVRSMRKGRRFDT